ncbi:hypothetical protein M758_5G124900 [Ceratodon purpureus]|nr:hypothetical protein M758_5G124900 [Ceratodon purpureus]
MGVSWLWYFLAVYLALAPVCTMINGSRCGRISEWHAAHWMLECHNLQLRRHHTSLISSTNLRNLQHHHPDPSRR